jgi:methylenetetrahydrofolate--tRNA-(uracil-5-)-methyltransferase
MREVVVIGGGLAGCEAAWQLASRGVRVALYEMKPHQRTPAQTSDFFAELVCSNSLRAADPNNAVGLLKEEMRRAGSLIMQAADLARVPAGGAHAVDREIFGKTITERIKQHPNITVHSEEARALPEALAVLATGPLTTDALAQDLARVVGQERLYFYDSIAPILDAESVDREIVFAQSRYGKGEGDEYLNCPLDKEQYYAFVSAIRAGEKVTPHHFEEPKYFEGCLPIEVMAERGDDVLAYGPMKPVGLEDPRTQRRPYAVVQLRPEDVARTAYNMVGFQTRLTWPEQRRIFREFIPGLQRVEFLRMGSVHRNTFLDGPKVLSERLQLRARPGVFLAGQITGVEGYVESTSIGLLVGLFAYGEAASVDIAAPPRETALGSMLSHVTTPREKYQPSNITHAHFLPLEKRHKKHERGEAYAKRARVALAPWIDSLPLLASTALAPQP